MKLAKLLIGVVVTVAFVSFAVFSYKGTSEPVTKITKYANATSVAMLERQYSKYIGPEVNGATVVNACRKFKNEFEVKVTNGSVTKLYNVNTGTLANKPSSADYINPNLIFSGELAYDVNGSLIGITFQR